MVLKFLAWIAESFSGAGTAFPGCFTCGTDLVVTAEPGDKDTFMVDGRPVKWCPRCDGRIVGYAKRRAELERIKARQ